MARMLRGGRVILYVRNLIYKWGSPTNTPMLAIPTFTRIAYASTSVLSILSHVAVAFPGLLAGCEGFALGVSSCCLRFLCPL
ncbi:hypothetical protein L211DRAFT_67622 [Terfezia boudieri ATCC MYA-4762]|uniref:Uncharacterized protein n=1 Tax=Terfezia boudieri ATCC MYA-4762 TaxID=1051890 RepID=A0A3N4LXT3_9PEZI|nr:hypothetical protein L211DRAFT_67622 [Terfezia boudieri ATCC MYA-4762]